ncbi:trypsin-like serine peptidase [Streptomyces sp. NPDC054796]|uniref:Trypsin-like serine protease n=1 Tax=Streptomyces daliensis TaxID=299421 RepID=A0A8T4IQ29_9ACTN|nr:trypsin-like serine protease [Streptomyces daliensis]
MISIRAAVAALVTTATAFAVMGASAPTVAPLPDSPGDRWPGGTSKTVGKLVSQLPGGQGEVCSAAIVDSPNGSVLATAAHCVRSPEQKSEPQAMYFLPGYDRAGGAEAVVKKGWKIESWHTAPQWDVNKQVEQVLPHDWAFLKVAKRNGRTIQETQGAGNTLQFEPVGGGRTATLGYPVAPPYDGETLHYCSGNAHLYKRGEIADANVGALALKPCKLTQGVSGGPWLRNYDSAKQAGTLVAVTSVGDQDELLGRPYPASARSLFARVGGG